MSRNGAYWDVELETMPRDQLKAYQFKLLKENIELAYYESPYYKQLFKAAGVAPFHLERIEDIKKYPTIDKKVLRSRQEVQPDFGDLVCAPEEDFVFLSASSGSTGVPTASPFTATDFEASHSAAIPQAVDVTSSPSAVREIPKASVSTAS